MWIIIINDVETISPLQNLEQTSLKELITNEPFNLEIYCPMKYTYLKIFRPLRNLFRLIISSDTI